MKRKHVLLALSVFIAVIDITFVYINYRFSHENFHANVQAEARRNHVTFNVALDQMYTDLLMVATLYAQSPKIQNLFYNGMTAVREEGGGAGGETADYWRKKLFDEVGTGWLAASQQYRIRQLHFHLGPGSTSFLRVHRADKFGDNMDDVRHIISEVNRTQENNTGFETGRVYSGLRGVVPVFATDNGTGEQVHVGALEAGTSFSKIIEILDDGLGAAFSVLLTREHIQEAMWPSAQEKIFGKMDADCRCVVEATSRPGVENLLRKIPFIDGRPTLETPYMIEIGDSTFAATFYPLRDFLGQKDPDRKNVGAVLIWQDVTQALADLDEQQWVNVYFAIFGFIILEILLFGAFAVVTRNLERVVKQRTLALKDVNETLEHEIEIKNRFFSIIAHDLRSPFNTLLGMTRMLEGYVDLNDKSKVQKYAGQVRNAGEQFYQLLQGLLEWSSHQMSNGSVEAEAFSLHEIVDETLAVLSPLAINKGIQVNNMVGQHDLISDRTAIDTVLRNLVSNATKFVRPDGQIDIDSRDDGDFIAIEVTDNGIGLAGVDIDALFSIDQKTTTTGTDGELGTGLGLPLCKDLVEQIGGTIKAEDLNGQGARFTFTIPKTD